MKMTIEMPNVGGCEVTACAYNLEGACHARAITIGNGVHPSCDTFFPSPRHTKDVMQAAGVGACNVTRCQHNRDLECHATAVRVGLHESHADCVTFAPR